MKSFSKIAASVAIVMLSTAPVIAAAPAPSATVSKAAVKAIGSKMRAGMVAKLGKKVVRKNGVEYAQIEGAAGAGAAGGGAGAGAGAAGAGAAGAGAAGAGAAAAGAGVAGGLGVAGAVAGVAAAAGVATAAASGGDNSP